MSTEIVVGVLAEVEADWLICPVPEDAAGASASPLLDDALGGALTRLRERGDLTGKLGEVTRLLDPRGIAARRVLMVGVGSLELLTAARLHRALMTAVRDVCTRSGRTIAVDCRAIGKLTGDEVVTAAALAIEVGSSSQQLYRGEPERHPLVGVKLVCDGAVSGQSVEQGLLLGESINLTRELVNRHPGEVFPESFADRAALVAREAGLSCDILDESRLKQERMGALLGVARGSSRPPRMVVLEYRGGAAQDQPLALVGKGVTFDSGGLSLKPSDSMKSMKADMAGAATVLGAMSAIARLKLPVNVLGLMGLVENMPGGAAYKLGEVLTARNGVTIEIHNTDAEGRLVLADVLSYAVDRGVARIVDLATLTGACVVALGEEVTGAFTNNQPWCNAVLQSAALAGEEIWQLPMFDSYSDQLKSDVADCKNVGTRWGGAITAAKFLEKFVAGTPWVHLDIAGPAFADSSKPHLDGGGTGTMVRTLVELASRSSKLS
ncbi:MAG: leucyl aminopeptidase [Planctomycetaceae bacterium]